MEGGLPKGGAPSPSCWVLGWNEVHWVLLLLLPLHAVAQPPGLPDSVADAVPAGAQVQDAAAQWGDAFADATEAVWWETNGEEAAASLWNGTLPYGWKATAKKDSNDVSLSMGSGLEWSLDNETAAKVFNSSEALAALWNATLALRDVSTHFDFCVRNLKEEASQTWPWPLPLPPDDEYEVCSAPHTLAPYLCRPDELIHYLSTVRGDRQPETPNCNLDTDAHAKLACNPGWAGRFVDGLQAVVPCCDGYFCPSSLTCMIPCPFGSYCPRATLHRNTTRCMPYKYKPASRAQGCGGADTWNTNSHIYCPGGYYCNSTTHIPSMQPASVALLDAVDGFVLNSATWTITCSLGFNNLLHPSSALLYSGCCIGTETITNNFVGISADFTTFFIAVLVYKLVLMLGEAKQERDRRRDHALLQKHEHDLLHFQGRARAASAAAHRRRQNWILWIKNAYLACRGLPPVSYVALGSHHTSLDDIPLQTMEPTHSSPSLLVSSVGDEEEGTAAPSEAAEVEAEWEERGTPNGTPNSKGQRILSVDTGTGDGNGTMSPSRTPFRAGEEMVERPLINVDFYQLGLRLKGSNTRILHGVTGRLRGGYLTAIMGPSGAGKTTFLMALVDKASFGKITGEVRINGYKRRLKSMRPVMGFVPQDDVMHSDLTVDENLWLNAEFRLPDGLTRNDKLVFVERAIRVLGLQEVRHSIVGDAVARGISGGQRKRVNVGIELVIDPMLLFCDEPTSGLDSTSSKLVVRALRTVARAAVTVGVVCHQPSFEIFQMFDDLLLLGPGGQTVYMGTEKNVYGYFETLGFLIPERGSPPEYLLDVIAGLEKLPGSHEGLKPEELFERWEAYSTLQMECPSPVPTPATAAAGSGFAVPVTPGDAPLDEDTNSDRCCYHMQVWCNLLVQVVIVWLEGLRDDLSEALAWAFKSNAPPLRRTPGFLQQTKLLMLRTTRKRFRHPMSVTMDYSIFIFTGSVLGLVNPGQELPNNVPDIVYNIVAIGLMTTVSCLRTFGPEQAVFRREASSGMNRVSFFVAKDTIDHFGTFVKPALYMAMYYALAQPRMDFTDAYIVTVAISYCCTGIAYLLSLTLEQSTAQLTASVVVLLNALISTQTQLKTDAWLTWCIYDGSFARWGLEGFVIAEARKLQGVWLLTRCGALESLGYRIDNFWGSVQMLVFLGLLFRSMACGCIFFLNRSTAK